ncbi:hypothetical protein BD626DRAFT_259754 [Schizophyllum amplum]|uniref:Uncharacterized protein n=1 Tax=Schizophyllum amplum TaxID=97359 RepID=A0A550BUJ0_9AGAR|nr:hypothetical protein BD626DRAFT_259754 [Auriculariopsis ampla]
MNANLQYPRGNFSGQMRRAGGVKVEGFAGSRGARRAARSAAAHDEEVLSPSRLPDPAPPSSRRSKRRAFAARFQGQSKCKLRSFCQIFGRGVLADRAGVVEHGCAGLEAKSAGWGARRAARSAAARVGRVDAYWGRRKRIGEGGCVLGRL